ncbi:MAG: RsmB/NOP family class I SAM-dependent RNA methyltransferase [Pseudomonadota bacterium]
MRDHVYDVLRRLGQCAELGGGDSGRALILGLLRLRGDDPAQAFTGEGHAPAPLTSAELDAGVAKAGPDLNVPDWARGMLADRFGPNIGTLLSRLGERAPLYLRLNIRKADMERALQSLATDGIVAEKSPLLDTAFEVTEGARRVRLSAAYRDGLVEMQDLSVQLGVAAVDWPKTGRILDYCAGGGGKSLAIACLSEASLFAHDGSARRMLDLPERARRAGVSLSILEPEKAAHSGPYDAVLCDVPCSGSGTWRRDPEAKWRRDADDLDRLVGVQSQILDTASDLVRPGGMLVYMTCSLFEAENDGQIHAFIDRHADWSVKSQRMDTPLTASDGFFTTVLQHSGS